jgi:hypothetical protein
MSNMQQAALESIGQGVLEAFRSVVCQLTKNYLDGTMDLHAYNAALAHATEKMLALDDQT